MATAVAAVRDARRATRDARDGARRRATATARRDAIATIETIVESTSTRDDATRWND
jgi:hypothetical protein